MTVFPIPTTPKTRDHIVLTLEMGFLSHDTTFKHYLGILNSALQVERTLEWCAIGVADEGYSELKQELHDLHRGREGSVFMTRSFDRLSGYVNYLADIVRGRLRV